MELWHKVALVLSIAVLTVPAGLAGPSEPGLNERVEALEARAGELGGDVTGIQAAIGSIEGRIDQLAAEPPAAPKLAEFFLFIDGVEGESTDAKHRGWIELSSWSWGETQTASSSVGGGAGAGRVSMQDFNFVTTTSKASPVLFLMCATGEHIPKAELAVRKAGSDQHDYLVIKLEDVLVSSFQTGGAQASDSLPMDQFSLNFAKIEFEYTPQTVDGSAAAPVRGGYDLQENRKT